MTKFSIPESYKPGFHALIKLSNKHVEMIAKEVCNLPVGTGPVSFHENLVEKVKVEDISHIAVTIFSLGSLLNNYEDKIQLSKELANSYNEDLEKKLKSTELDALSSKLHRIIENCDNLKMSYKTFKLLSEIENSFLTTRIISDVRLIFQDNIEDKSNKAVILHQLKIEYQNNNAVKSLYFTLNRENLGKIREQVERAISKEDIIRNSYSNIDFIEVKE